MTALRALSLSTTLDAEETRISSHLPAFLREPANFGAPHKRNRIWRCFAGWVGWRILGSGLHDFKFYFYYIFYFDGAAGNFHRGDAVVGLLEGGFAGVVSVGVRDGH